MLWSERIVVDHEILAGKPVIRGDASGCELMLELLAAGQSERDLCSDSLVKRSRVSRVMAET